MNHPEKSPQPSFEPHKKPRRREMVRAGVVAASALLAQGPAFGQNAYEIAMAQAAAEESAMQRDICSEGSDMEKAMHVGLHMADPERPMAFHGMEFDQYCKSGVLRRALELLVGESRGVSIATIPQQQILAGEWRERLARFGEEPYEEAGNIPPELTGAERQAAIEEQHRIEQDAFNALATAYTSKSTIRQLEASTRGSTDEESLRSLQASLGLHSN